MTPEEFALRIKQMIVNVGIDPDAVVKTGAGCAVIESYVKGEMTEASFCRSMRNIGRLNPKVKLPRVNQSA